MSNSAWSVAGGKRPLSIDALLNGDGERKRRCFGDPPILTRGVSSQLDPAEWATPTSSEAIRPFSVAEQSLRNHITYAGALPNNSSDLSTLTTGISSQLSPAEWSIETPSEPIQSTIVPEQSLWNHVTYAPPSDYFDPLSTQKPWTTIAGNSYSHKYPNSSYQTNNHSFHESAFMADSTSHMACFGSFGFESSGFDYNTQRLNPDDTSVPTQRNFINFTESEHILQAPDSKMTNILSNSGPDLWQAQTNFEDICIPSTQSSILALPPSADLDPDSSIEGLYEINTKPGESPAPGITAALQKAVDVPKSTTEADLITNIEYDACFGVIITTSISSYSAENGIKFAPVDIKPFGNISKLHFQDSNTYAGLITLPVLNDVLENYTVQFKATLIASKESCAKKDREKNSAKSRDYDVRIVINGLKQDRAAIGKLLSDGQVFLQHPFATECAKNLKYCNPHYLVRPGTELPALEHLCLDEESDEKDGEQMRMDEASLVRLQRIFDNTEADGISGVPMIDPSPRLNSTLMGHQTIALAMMIEKECGFVENTRFPTLWKPFLDEDSSLKYRHIITGEKKSRPEPILGGVLADEMGLGKTLCMLALVCFSLDHSEKRLSEEQDLRVSSTLIISPKSISSWEYQISKHISSNKLKIAHYYGANRAGLKDRLQEYDVVITTYGILKSTSEMQGPLMTNAWLRIVLDEAHHIRNRTSKTFEAACNLQARYRWCLTGTPIHNSLDDYGALLSFIGVQPFDSKPHFDYWITSPFKNNKPGSLQNLKDMVRATCLRRTKCSPSLSLDIPPLVPKTESVYLHHGDSDIYDFFKKLTAGIAEKIDQSEKRNQNSKKFSQGTILSLMNFLRLICNHGKDLLPQTAISILAQSGKTTQPWEAIQGINNTCNICGAELEDTRVASLEYEAPDTMRGISLCSTCSLMEDDREEENEEATESQHSHPTTKYKPRRAVHIPTRPSAKILRLLHNIHKEQQDYYAKISAKSVIFSFYTKMLDLVEIPLRNNGFKFYRIDGKSSFNARSEALREFNATPGYAIMLASIGTCGEGIDFTAASNVHLLEPQWNPMVEAQAVDRVHRIGQTRPVAVTRYIVPESIETYIQWLQQDKLNLIQSSINTTETSDALPSNEERWKVLRKYLG